MAATKKAPKKKTPKTSKKKAVKAVSNKKSTKKPLKGKKKRKVTKRRKPRTITVVSPISPDMQFIIAQEMADDKLIEEGILGSVIPSFVYEFKQDGNPVRGLTVQGVDEVVRMLSRRKDSGYKIRVNPQYLEKGEVEREGEKGFEVWVYAENMLTGEGYWGGKFEPYYKVGRKGRYKNTFAVEKALSKAQRNAQRKLIPQAVALKMMELLLDNVKQLDKPVSEYLQSSAKIKEKPVATTEQELGDMIATAIKKCKTVEEVEVLTQQTRESDKLGMDFKDDIIGIAMEKIDELKKE